MAENVDASTHEDGGQQQAGRDSCGAAHRSEGEDGENAGHNEAGEVLRHSKLGSPGIEFVGEPGPQGDVSEESDTSEQQAEEEGQANPFHLDFEEVGEALGDAADRTVDRTSEALFRCGEVCR